MPDCGLSGATTMILPRSFTASTRFIIPGAVTPSSLVIRMTGFSFEELIAGAISFLGCFFAAAFLAGRAGFFFAICSAKVMINKYSLINIGYQKGGSKIHYPLKI